MGRSTKKMDREFLAYEKERESRESEFDDLGIFGNKHENIEDDYNGSWDDDDNYTDEFDNEDDDMDEDAGKSSVYSDLPRTKFSSKEEGKKRDLSGPAVRKRFYKIMEYYHSGDEEKRAWALSEAMIELEGFIHSIIKKSYSTYTGAHFYDLLQEGYLGVMVGMDKYDPDISAPTTFFFHYIKHEMQGFITRNVDKTTSHYSSNIKKINKVVDEFESRGEAYTNVDIAIQTGMTVETVEQSMAIRGYRNEIHTDGCVTNIIDEKVSSELQTPEEAILEKEKNVLIYRAIDDLLTEDEIKVLEMHFGINNKDVCSETEAAKKLGIPKDKVKRLLNGAIRKLRDSNLNTVFSDHLHDEAILIEEVDVPLVPREKDIKNIDEYLSIDIDF